MIFVPICVFGFHFGLNRGYLPNWKPNVVFILFIDEAIALIFVVRHFMNVPGELTVVFQPV